MLRTRGQMESIERVGDGPGQAVSAGDAYLNEYRARILAIRQELIGKGYEGNCIEIKNQLQNPESLSMMFLAELSKYCERRQGEVGVRITQLTANKYHRVLRYLKEYTAVQYKKTTFFSRP